MGLCVGLAPGQAQAAPGCGTGTPNGGGGMDFVVSGSVLTTCQVGTNDTLTIQPSGSVTTAAGNGVDNLGGTTSIVNDGLISAAEIFRGRVSKHRHPRQLYK